VKHYEPMLTEGAQEASRKVLTAAKLTRWCGAGRIQKVAHYCESDVLNTYRLWFIYEHFCEKVTTIQLQFSEGKRVSLSKRENPKTGTFWQLSGLARRLATPAASPHIKPNRPDTPRPPSPVRRAIN
jgi:Predicted 3'-5' exonuclease related to the exonuclease domain of PolB